MLFERACPSRQPRLAELEQILKREAARFSANYMKRPTALIELSEFDWSEAEMRREGCDSCAGVGVIAREENDLSLPLGVLIRPKLFRREMIEGLHDACSHKCLSNDLRGETISKLFW